MAGEKQEAELRIFAEKIAKGLESKGLKRGTPAFDKAFSQAARDIRAVGKNISETGTYSRPAKPKPVKTVTKKQTAPKAPSSSIDPLTGRKMVGQNYFTRRPATRGTSSKKTR